MGWGWDEMKAVLHHCNNANGGLGYRDVGKDGEKQMDQGYTLATVQT